MKKSLTKTLVSLLLAVSVLSTLIAFPVSAEEVLPEQNEASAVCIEAKAVSRKEPYDPDDPRYNSTAYKARKIAGDIIIGIGEAIIPFGSTIKNHIKQHSPAKDGSTDRDLFISFVTDTASYVCPLAAPAVSITKDIVKKFIDLI